jgi:hypothetical protein
MQAAGYSKGSTIPAVRIADIFSEAEDTLIALHLFHNCLIQGFDN